MTTNDTPAAAFDPGCYDPDSVNEPFNPDDFSDRLFRCPGFNVDTQFDVTEMGALMFRPLRVEPLRIEPFDPGNRLDVEYVREQMQAVAVLVTAAEAFRAAACGAPCLRRSFEHAAESFARGFHRDVSDLVSGFRPTADTEGWRFRLDDTRTLDRLLLQLNRAQHVPRATYHNIVWLAPTLFAGLPGHSLRVRAAWNDLLLGKGERSAIIGARSWRFGTIDDLGTAELLRVLAGLLRTPFSDGQDVTEQQPGPTPKRVLKGGA